MTPPTDPSLLAFIQRLPKTETHLHIEAALPFDLLQSLGDPRFAKPPASWAPDFRFRDFTEFDTQILSMLVPWFTSAERYHASARRTFALLREQNVRYVETSFHLGILEFIGGSGEEIVAAIRDAAPSDLEVRVFAGMTADLHRPPMDALIRDSLRWRWLAGIDLHGHERYPVQDWMPEIWRRALDAGKETKAHAGEFGPAANVREAVERLGVRRVQHGVSAIDDAEVVALLVREGVTLDTTPISNVKLRVVPSMREHPLRKLVAAGVRCTVSTDDPLVFGNTLTDEYVALGTEADFTRAELVQLARNGFDAGTMNTERKRAAVRELDGIAAELG
jgi:adenosine deaminase